jgi:hypothetical protein
MYRALIGRIRPFRQQNAMKTARPEAVREIAMNRCSVS